MIEPRGNVAELDSYRNKGTPRLSIATQGVSFRSAPEREAAVSKNYLPTWDAAVRSRLNYLMTLPGGWDNADAKAVDPWTAEFANTLLHYVWPVDGPVPFVAPTCYGGLQFEWRSTGLELEIEVVRQHHLEVYVSDAWDETEVCFTCKHDLTDLFKAVQKFGNRCESGVNASSAA
jgi:hypothetical protein